VRTADLDATTVYDIRDSYAGDMPAALLDWKRWHQREPQGNNTERPWLLYTRAVHRHATVGWRDPSRAAGLPMLVWTRPAGYHLGDFGADEHEALARAAGTVFRRWSTTRVGIDARQVRELLVGEVGEDAAKWMEVRLIQPGRILRPRPAPVSLDRPSVPSDEYGGMASIIARVYVDGERAATVQDVQRAWRVLSGGTGELAWAQVAMAGGGRDADDDPVWSIRGLDPALVAQHRERAGRFMLGTIGSSVWETTDSAEHGWQPKAAGA
jgi:hypothetical protein